MKLLVFDMGHVFINFCWDTVCDAFAKRAGIPREQFGKVLDYMETLGYEKGKISTERFLSELNEQLNLQLDCAEFTQLWNLTFEEDRDMRLLMDHLAQRWPLYLLSNTNENHFGYLQERFDVSRNFRELILSYEVGYTKPEAEIYEEVLNRSGYAAADCLLIDDLEANIRAANHLGLNTILYRGIDDLQNRLPGFGVTV
jgi:glucose-1-phosphatase